MNPSILKIKLEALIKKVGSSADEVANYLRQCGIKGDINEECHCPIANLIKEELEIPPSYKVSVGCSAVSLYYDHLEGAETICFVDLSEGVSNFIKAFDLKFYTDLIAKNN